VLLLRLEPQEVLARIREASAKGRKVVMLARAWPSAPQDIPTETTTATIRENCMVDPFQGCQLSVTVVTPSQEKIGQTPTSVSGGTGVPLLCRHPLA